MTTITRRPMTPVQPPVHHVKMLPPELIVPSWQPAIQSPAPKRDTVRGVIFDTLTQRWRVNLRVGSTTIPIGGYSKRDEAEYALRQATQAIQSIHRIAHDEAKAKVKADVKRRRRHHA